MVHCGSALQFLCASLLNKFQKGHQPLIEVVAKQQAVGSFSNNSLISCSIIKNAISSIVIGLKNCYFPQFTCQVVMRQFLIEQFVIRQFKLFKKPITVKVAVYINQSHSQLIVVNFRGTSNKLCRLCQSLYVNCPFLSSLGYSPLLGNCDF